MNGGLPTISDYNDIEGNLLILLNKCREFDDIDLLKIQKAYRYTIASHEKEFRKNKEPYYTHPLLATLYYLYIFDFPDTNSIAACLLHDTAEHSKNPEEKLEDIEKKFGLEVRKLVNGLTNIRGTKTDEALSFSKLMLEMIKDYRVMLIKLCDRLHNLVTLDGIKDETKRRIIAEESLKFFVPIAKWIGVWKLKQHLEEKAFSYLDPENYKIIKDNLSKKFLEFAGLIKELEHKVKQVMKYYGVDCNTSVTHKSHYELYQLMEKGAKSIEDIDNFYSFVIYLNNNDVPYCYFVLGILYKYFTPFEMRDYIAFPKFNQYQSLLTYLYNEDRKKIEVLIRTLEMDDIATDRKSVV